MFLDIANIHCKAGNGGDGLVSFHREKFVQRGGPNGGDGGKGGHIIFMADPSANTLQAFKYTAKFNAEDGEKGGKKNCAGKSGQDLIIKVPRGTVVKDYATGQIVADVFEEDKQYLLLEGGKGGRGNARFATSVKQSPHFSELGERTEQHKLTLELKTIADVGLVGFPNVGKSTLLSVISAARPKIADYHFTTLTPNLGVCTADDDSFLVADIPGLIEGAAAGAGLGHSFLRHIERVRLIVHIVDISGSENRCPSDDYKKIRQELKKYSQKLAALPEILVANKTDLTSEDALKKAVQKLKKATNKDVVLISAATTSGITELKRAINLALKDLPKVSAIEFEEFRYQSKDKNEMLIEKLSENSFYVSGGMLEHLARKVVLNDIDSFRWFQKTLKLKGVIDALKLQGLKDGDQVKILDIEFEYRD
jgi:GTP-binding protein